MKKIKLLLFSLLSCLMLTGCIYLRTSSIKNDLSYSFKEQDEKKLRDSMQEFEDCISGKTKGNPVIKWNYINTVAYDIATIRTIENINYAKGDDEAFDRYTYFQDLLYEVMKWQEKQYQAIYNSDYSSTFFSGMSTEEIEELLNSVKPDKYYELENEVTRIQKAYQDLPTDINSFNVDSYRNNVSNYYKELISTLNEEAALFNYESYIDYAYEDIYSREYKVEDVYAFDNYVRDYIVPFYFDLTEELKNDTLLLSQSDKEKYVDFNLGSKKHYEDFNDVLSSYASYVGGKYETNYNYFTKKGKIVLGDSNANIDGAFTTYLYSKNLDEPIMYLGPSYQDVMTVVHEFGHYNAFMQHGALSAMSYDLAETQSQGNEALFMVYLLNSNYYSEELSKFIIKSYTREALVTIIMATIINRFEQWMYRSDLETIDFSESYKTVVEYYSDYDKLMKSIYGDNIPLVEYWQRVCIEHPGYYISYAISKIPTLELLAFGLNGNDAKDKYEKIYMLNNLSMADFLMALEDAKIYSPFDEEAFKTINSIKKHISPLFVTI